jgi:excisionase family DNA binding protein
MKIPRSKAEFQKWLRAEIVRLDDPEPDENQYYDAVAAIRNAGRLAIALELPKVAEICEGVRTQALALSVAQRILTECLNATKDDESLEFLTVKEVADRLKCSERTVYEMVRSGRLHAQRAGKGRGAIRITAADLQNIGPVRHLRHL